MFSILSSSRPRIFKAFSTTILDSLKFSVAQLLSPFLHICLSILALNTRRLFAKLYSKELLLLTFLIVIDFAVFTTCWIFFWIFSDVIKSAYSDIISPNELKSLVFSEFNIPLYLFIIFSAFLFTSGTVSVMDFNLCNRSILTNKYAL